MKEEILAEEKASDLPGLMAKLRQVRTNTHVVPLGQAKMIRNTRKVPKKKRKRGWTRAGDRDPIHAEVVEAQVHQAQAKKKATGPQKTMSKGKRKAKACDSDIKSTTSDEAPDPVTPKRKLPTRSTRATKKAKTSHRSHSGSESSSTSWTGSLNRAKVDTAASGSPLEDDRDSSSGSDPVDSSHSSPSGSEVVQDQDDSAVEGQENSAVEEEGMPSEQSELAPGCHLQASPSGSSHDRYDWDPILPEVCQSYSLFHREKKPLIHVLGLVW
jgi:hypothetical protein